MDKRIFVALTFLFMIFVGFQFVQPVAAVKVVDHGTKYESSNSLNDLKLVWKTYQYNNNFIKVYLTCYYKSKGRYVVGWHSVTTITKVTKSSIKIRKWNDGNCGPSVIITRKKTKLTAAQYYWRVYRPQDILIG